jgi:hypothetical protein
MLGYKRTRRADRQVGLIGGIDGAGSLRGQRDADLTAERLLQDRQCRLRLSIGGVVRSGGQRQNERGADEHAGEQRFHRSFAFRGEEAGTAGRGFI